ncbi:MAG: hypothetical protein ABL868_12190, partial [Sulfuriferula sp.]
MDIYTKFGLKVAEQAQVRKEMQEMQLHQIELEKQNAELRKKYAELEASHARLKDYYNISPMGYLTLDRYGLIQEANHT